MTFEQIVCVDETGLTPEGYRDLQQFSTKPMITYSDCPRSDEEILTRIQEADCVLVSPLTPISAEVLQAAKQLQYVGMCCSLYDASSANVDIKTAQSHKIDVRGVRDYGDEGVVEFIIAQLIFLYKGLGKDQWGKLPTELKGKILGIIGLGTTGTMVAKAAQSFGMHVWYYSRTRRQELEHEELRYVPLEELLEGADVITTHLPRRTVLLGAEEFARMKPGAILVNTSLGPTFEVPAFCEWIERGDSYAIFDADGARGYAELLEQYPTVIISEKISGRTAEAKIRLTEKVIANIQDFLEEVSHNS